MPDLSLTKTTDKKWNISVQPLHWALMSYYAKSRGESRSDALRKLIEAVIEWEDNFDAAAFKTFVMNELAPEETDVEARDLLLSQVDKFVRTWSPKKR